MYLAAPNQGCGMIKERTGMSQAARVVPRRPPKKGKAVPYMAHPFQASLSSVKRHLHGPASPIAPAPHPYSTAEL